MGQSELLRGEAGKGGSPAGRGLGCLKLLLSENRDWDSAAAPSKGERAVRSDTLMGTTRLGLVKPGGGEGESLGGIWKRKNVLKPPQDRQTDTPEYLPVLKSRHLPFQLILGVYHWDCRHTHRPHFRYLHNQNSLKMTSFTQKERTLPVTVTIRGEWGEGSTLIRA